MMNRETAIQVVKNAMNRKLSNGFTEQEVEAATVKAMFLQRKYSIFVEIVYLNCNVTQVNTELTMYF